MPASKRRLSAERQSPRSSCQSAAISADTIESIFHGHCIRWTPQAVRSQLDPDPDPDLDPELDLVPNLDLDLDHDHGHGNDLHPDLDPDLDAGADPDLGPDLDPDLDLNLDHLKLGH